MIIKFDFYSIKGTNEVISWNVLTPDCFCTSRGKRWNNCELSVIHPGVARERSWSVSSFLWFLVSVFGDPSIVPLVPSTCAPCSICESLMSLTAQACRSQETKCREIDFRSSMQKIGRGTSSGSILLMVAHPSFQGGSWCNFYKKLI